MSSAGAFKLEIHMTTPTGGPIVLGDTTIDIPISAAPQPGGATLTIDTKVLRHEIAAMLIDAAHQIEHG